MDSETVYIMDYIRGLGEDSFLVVEEYIEFLEELIAELQTELEAMQDGA